MATARLDLPPSEVFLTCIRFSGKITLMEELKRKDPPPLLGEFLVKDGLITVDRLDEALQVQKTLGSYKPLGQVLVDLNILSRRQLNAALDGYRKRSPLGQIMVKAGVIDEQQLQQALAYQKSHRVRLGQAVLKLHHITEDALKQALATQLNIEYLDLDSLEIDRSLNKWIKNAYALKYRVCPVRSADKELTIAMDDPTNVAVIHEIETSAKQKIKIVTASEVMIGRALKRVYQEEDHGISGREERAGSHKEQKQAREEKAELVIDENFTFETERKVSEYKPLGESPDEGVLL